MDQELSNIAETLAKEMKAPIEIISEAGGNMKRVALPPGWTLVEKDDDAKLLAAPRRKIAKVRLHDAESFIDYTKRHGSLNDSTIWCIADYKAGKVGFTAILNDHGEEESQAAFRDHRATFSPEFSEEWNRWIGKNKQPFNQAAFAEYIEENIKDIASVEGSPTGSQMLEMALAFEANQDMKFKSAIRLQNGGVQMAFTQDDDAGTLAKMSAFDRFTVGFPVFWNGDAYRINARLRYRVREGKLTFWFELIRQDLILEAATQTLIGLIRDKTGNPFFFGEPFQQ
ncbi:MAG: YfdQ family protein [Sulfuricaulis sp.]|nr:YfdQ family protein [Sulfuricaulis sp.]